MSDNAIVKVNFHGDELWAIEKDSKVWVPLRRPCEALGLDEEGQRQKLKKQPWATTCLMQAVADDGKNREMFCVALESMPMWMATIEPTRVKGGDRIKAKLIAYQCEAAKALADHFLHRRAATAYELRVREWLLEQKTEHKVTWKLKLIRELCRLYGKPYKGGAYPQWLSSPMDKIYRIILGNDIKRELKARNPTPHFESNHHQFVRQQDLLDEDFIVVHTLAKHASTVAEFWHHMQWQFGRKAMQMPLPGTEARALPECAPS